MKNILSSYPHAGEVERFLERVQRLEPVLVVLFGSVARGDFRESSDADMLVLFEQPRNWSEVYALGGGIVQPVVKTTDEFLALLREGEPFAFEMLEDGVLLYDANGYEARLAAAADAARLQHGLVRGADGWRWSAT